MLTADRGKRQVIFQPSGNEDFRHFFERSGGEMIKKYSGNRIAGVHFSENRISVSDAVLKGSLTKSSSVQGGCRDPGGSQSTDAPTVDIYGNVSA
jgi:hypothetical protein